MTAPANHTQFLSTGSAQVTARDFDPAHPDVEILEAFVNVRDLRTQLYRLDDATPPDRTDPRSQPLADRCTGYEEGVTGNWATTPAGIAARLMLAIPEIDQSRWVDRGLMEHGLFALYKLKGELDFPTYQVVQAAWELMHLEWETALATYERLAVDRQFARTSAKLIDTELEGLRNVGLQASDILLELQAHAATLERRFDVDGAVERLVRTPTPNLEAYRRKVEVIQLEGYHSESAAWLLRDANLLFDTIAHGSPIVTPDPMPAGDPPAIAGDTPS